MFISAVCNCDSDNEGEGTMSAPVAVPLDILQGTVDTGAAILLYYLNLVPYHVWLEGPIFNSAVTPSMRSTRGGRFMRPHVPYLLRYLPHHTLLRQCGQRLLAVSSSVLLPSCQVGSVGGASWVRAVCARTLCRRSRVCPAPRYLAYHH